MKKINCGGFYINEDNFEITDDGELKLKSGAGGGNVVRCPLHTTDASTPIAPVYEAEMTVGELMDADVIIFTITDEFGTEEFLCTRRGCQEDIYGFDYLIANHSGQAIFKSVVADSLDAYPHTPGEPA